MGNTYYLSATGDDAQDGLSELRPWKTLAKLRTSPPEPGSIVRLRRGDVFLGTIDWSFLPGGPMGHPDQPILVDSYGNLAAPLPEVVSHDDQCGLVCTGPGGITIGAVQFRGSVESSNQHSGISLSPHQDGGRLRNCQLVGTEVTGYPKGVWIGPGDDVLLQDVKLWKCGLATYLWGIQRLKLLRCRSWEHDWPWTVPADGGNQGQGFSVYDSNEVTVEECRAWKNGLRTTLNCGPAGFHFQDCDYVSTTRCSAWNNGDGAGQDGQGFDLYGCRDSKFTECNAHSNLVGFSLFNDPWCHTVERCSIDRCLASGNLTDLAFVGTLLDCTVTQSRFLGTGSLSYKTFDVADALPGSLRRVELWGNEFRAPPGILLLEAVPGLVGVIGLEANTWDGNSVVVREKWYNTLVEAVTAEPVILR